MATNFYGATSVLGDTTTGDIAVLPYSDLADGDVCFVINGTNFYVYQFDDDNGGSESLPQIVKPNDAGTGQGRWVLQSIYVEDISLVIDDVVVGDDLEVKGHSFFGDADGTGGTVTMWSNTAGDHIKFDPDGKTFTLTDVNLVMAGAGTISGGDNNISNVATISVDAIASDGASFTILNNWTNSGNTVADLGTITTVDINGGTIDGTTIGQSTATLVTGTTGTFASLNIGSTVIKDATVTDDGVLYLNVGTAVQIQDTTQSQDAVLRVGQDDVQKGDVTIYGDTSSVSQGGILRLYTSATYDSTLNYFLISPWQDDLRIGSALDTDALELSAPSGGGATLTFNVNVDWDASGVTCTDLGSVTTADINGGTIDGVTIFGVATDTTGADASIVTGTSGTSGGLSVWNGDGDLVAGPEATAASDMIVATGSGTWAKKTIAEVGAILETDLDHGNLNGLSDDDHTQYLLASGARALAGAWDMGDYALTNVNIDSGAITGATLNVNVISAGQTWGAAQDFGDYALTNVNIDSGSITGATLNTNVINAGQTWSAAQDMNDQALTNINIDSGTIDSATLAATCVQTEWDAAYTHVSSDGSDHTFIDQDVTSGATPTFGANNFSDGGGNAIVTTTQETNWDNHLVDNGADHSYIDQDVTSGASPTFVANNFSDGGGNAIVTTTQESNWDTHLSSDGSDHTFIDQDVTSGSSPTFDGSNITGISGATVSQVTATNEATDTTCFPVFAKDATGTVTLHTNANLAFDSNKGQLTVATITATTNFNVGGTTISDNTITDDGTLIFSAPTNFHFRDSAGTGQTTTLVVGASDAICGTILLHPDDDTSSPSIKMNVAPDYDTNTSQYEIRVAQDDLQIGSSGASALTFVGGVSESIKFDLPIDFNDEAMTNVNIDSGTIDAATLAATCTQAEWDAAYTHTSNNGSDHSFIDQDVTSGSSPTLDGTNFTNVTSATPTVVTVANEATDTSCYPLFATAATGDLGPRSNANLTFDSAKGDLTAASFTATTQFKVGDTIISDGVVADSSGLQFTCNIDFNDVNMTNVDIDSGDINGATVTSVTMADNGTIIMAEEPGTDHYGQGIVVPATTGTNAYGNMGLVYLNSADGQWDTADKDAESTAGVMLGMALGTVGNGVNILLQGMARDDTWGWTVGEPVYVGDAGAATDATGVAAFATNDVVRCIGYAITDDSIWFNPSMDWIEVA